MWKGVKRVLGVIAKVGLVGVKAALPDLAELAVTSPSLVIALHRMGVSVAAGVLAEALRRLAAAGVVDLAAGVGRVDSPLMRPYHLAMAENDYGHVGEASRAELRRQLIDTATPTEAWAELLHVMAGSGLAPIGDALQRGFSPLTPDSAVAAELKTSIESAVAAAREAGEDINSPLKVAGFLATTPSDSAQPVAQIKSNVTREEKPVTGFTQKTSP
jgi:hypothetical protein